MDHRSSPETDLKQRRYDMATTTYTYDIEVDDASGNELASGVLTIVVNTSVNPTQITGSFLPANSTTSIVCNINAWSVGSTGATNWSFQLTTANGGFPIKANGGAFNYTFTGNETPNGPQGHVNWPNPNPDEDFETTVTWQGDATEDPLAVGQGAS
jgi:hypothetical protein